MGKNFTIKDIKRFLESDGQLNLDGSLSQPKQLSQQEIDEVNRRRKQGTGSLPVLKYSTEQDKVVPASQTKEIAKGGLSSTLDTVYPRQRKVEIPKLSPVSNYASASNASNGVPDTKYTGSVPVLTYKDKNSVLAKDTGNMDELKSVMSTWADNSHAMTKE